MYLILLYCLASYTQTVSSAAGDSLVRRCVSGVVQEPQGPQEAAGWRVKGQAAVFASAEPEPDLQHRPVTAARPGAAQEVKGQPAGAPPTVPRPERLGTIEKSSVVLFSVFWRCDSFPVLILDTLCSTLYFVNQTLWDCVIQQCSSSDSL